MTPEILKQYLEVMTAARVAVFRLKAGEDMLEGSFLPEPLPEFKGEELTPGGWKSPSHLDQVEDVA